MAVALAAHLYGFSVNVTDSMPIGLYHLEPANFPITRGTIVQVCLPSPISNLGRKRGYLIAGTCADGAAPALKVVAATSGDRVKLDNRDVSVNGRPLQGSGTSAFDSHGRKLVHVAHGTFLLGPGRLWLWTPNPASWDSRYYGPISDRYVLGRATLLIPFSRWRYSGDQHAVSRL